MMPLPAVGSTLFDLWPLLIWSQMSYLSEANSTVRVINRLIEMREKILSNETSNRISGSVHN